MKLDGLIPRADLERLFLAHCLADGTKLGRSLDVRLSAAATEIRENILRAPDWRALREAGIAANAQIMGAPDDALVLARAIDATTAAELGRYEFAEVLRALGGHLKRQPETETAWERDLRRVSA